MGKTITSVAAASSTCAASTAPRRLRIDDPAARQPELEERERADHYEEQDRLRRGDAPARGDERVLVETVDEDVRGAARPALRHDVDQAEDLEEGVERVHHEEEEGHRREDRERDPPEDAHAARAVDPGGLLELLRHGLEAGQEEDDVEP